MIFQVALPMIIGPLIGQAIVNMSTNTYTNDFGELQKLPQNLIWLVSAIALISVFIPTIILIYKEKKLNISRNEGIIYDQNREN